MTIDAGELVVKISADISEMKAAVQLATQNIGQLETGTSAAGVAMGVTFSQMISSTVQFGKESVAAFEASELAVTRLTFFVGKDAADAFQTFAQQVEDSTIYSHQSVIALESQLSTFGVLPGSIQPAVDAITKYASATGKDLPEAGSQFIRALQGQGRELKLMGLQLNASDDASTHLDETINFLNGRFGDIAQTIRNTTAGQLDVLKNKLDSVKEAAGKDIVNAIGFWGNALKSVAGVLGITSDKLKYFTDVSTGNVTVQQAAIKALTDERAEIESQAKAIANNSDGYVRLTAEQQKRVVMITREIAELKKQAVQEKETSVAGQTGVQQLETKAQQAVAQQIAGLTLEMQKNDEVQNHIQQITLLTTDIKIQKSIEALEQAKADEAQITEITDIETQKRLATAQTSWEANASFADQFTVKLQDDISKNTSAFTDMAQSMIDQLSQSTAKMIVEGGKFSDVMKNLWQNMAEAFIAQVLRMIAEWLILQAMTGGVGGFGMGFMADGGMITEPSIITGMRTGTRHIAGEAGPEMVVPQSGGGGGGNYSFSGAPGPGDSSGGGSGGDIHINIQGQFLEGSPAKWQQMVQQQIVPAVRRWAMSSPTGPFNRVRGAS